MAYRVFYLALIAKQNERGELPRPHYSEWHLNQDCRFQQSQDSVLTITIAIAHGVLCPNDSFYYICHGFLGHVDAVTAFGGDKAFTAFREAEQVSRAHTTQHSTAAVLILQYNETDSLLHFFLFSSSCFIDDRRLGILRSPLFYIFTSAPYLNALTV